MSNFTKNKDRYKHLETFAGFLKIKFKDLNQLNTALTHGSYVKNSFSKQFEDNERLEFFGDAVLKLFISEYLMKKYPKYSEGQLSTIRAYVVSEKVLAEIANKINLDKYLLLGKNEKKNIPSSILGDALEALLAVIYYQGGLKAASKFVLKNWKVYIENVNKSKEKDNYKAVLQEHTQGKKLGLPIYKTLCEEGPDHNKIFEVGVFLNEKELARGKGKSKKDASQDAARNALKALE